VRCLLAVGRMPRKHFCLNAYKASTSPCGCGNLRNTELTCAVDKFLSVYDDCEEALKRAFCVGVIRLLPEHSALLVGGGGGSQVQPRGESLNLVRPQNDAVLTERLVKLKYKQV
jgi:hypothetical protein